MKYGHDETLSVIRKKRLVAILRGVPMEKLDGVVSALVNGGVCVLEFTFDHDRPGYLQENAAKIRHAVERYGDQVIVGCGTALTVQEVEAAHEAGGHAGHFAGCQCRCDSKNPELGMVSMPGALTPTEIVTAWNAGADIVKLFPAGELGLGYLKAIRGPLCHIPVSAVGGVKPENVKDFLDAGVCGFGVGGQLVLGSAVKCGEYAAIEARAREFTQAIAQWEAAR